MNSTNQPNPNDAVLGGVEGVKKRATTGSWRLLYAHDSEGKRTAGDINVLIEAIRHGHRVRMLIEATDNNYEYATDAEHLWIRNGVVFAQNNSEVSVFFLGDRLFIRDDSYYRMIVVSTKGDLEAIRWNVGEHKERGHSYHKVAMKWFAD